MDIQGEYLSPEEIFDKYSRLFNYLGEDTKDNPDIIKDYQQITDKKEQLKFVLDASLADKVRLFCSESFNYHNYDHFMHVLQVYQDHLDPDRDASAVALGLKRESLYSAMVGSPELAAVKIATAKINRLRADKTREAVCLHGFGSGIDKWEHGSIGHWADLCDAYKIALEEVSSTHEGDFPGWKEHMAVRELASWIQEGCSCCDVVQIMDSDSPRVLGFKEAIILGRLSKGNLGNIGRRFGGMQRLTRIDLHGIERFIGKAGYSKKRMSLADESNRLYDTEGYLKSEDHSEEEKKSLLDKENAFEIERQKRWRAKETGRINHKYNKLINKMRSEERKEAFEQRRQEELQKIENDVAERSAYFKNRSYQELIADIDSRREVLKRKLEKRRSLAEKAIDVHFELEVGDGKWDDEDERWYYSGYSKYRGCIDWINDAPFGVIKRAYKRLKNGEPVDDIYLSAIKEIISQPKEMVREKEVPLGGDVGQFIELWKGMHPDSSAEETVQFMVRARCVYERSRFLSLYNMLEHLRNGQMSLDVVEEYPWLLYQYDGDYCDGADNFPSGKNENLKYKWCSDHSFVWLDGDWGRQTIGKIIFTRLQAGTDETVHDATQWLSSFQIPEKTYDISTIKKQVEQGADNIDIEDYSMRLFDKTEEIKFLSRILCAPEHIRNRLNLSTKAQNTSRLFSSPEHIFIYEEIAKGENHFSVYTTEFDAEFERFKDTIQSRVRDYYDNNIVNSAGKGSTWRMPFDEFEKKVNVALNKLHDEYATARMSDERIGEIAQRLNQYGLNRKAYIDDATSWLVKHTVSPQQALTKAWSNRALAIANGVKDNASEINRWATAEAVIKGQRQYLESNGISAEDLTTTYGQFLQELSRCYGASQIANAIVKYKNLRNPNKILPAVAMPLKVHGRKFTGEILAYDDPRGMTIGYDTGCCMTIGGASNSCIESGYRDTGAGFFVYYDDNKRVNAQSYFFTDPDHPEIVVMDNIEANQGRDSDKIIDVYQEFFRQYLIDRFATDPNWKIRQVNVGTRYGKVAKTQVQRLRSTNIVPNNLSYYSDAREDQRILIRLTDEEIAEARKGIQTVKAGESVEPNHTAEPIVSPLGINQLPILQSLEAQLYPESMRQYDDEDFAYSELTMPGVEEYSFLVKAQEDASKEACGYCLAYEDSSKSDPNYQGKVVYIADFGILEDERAGMTAFKVFDELLRRLNEKGVEKVEMDARESTTYKLLTGKWGRRFLAKRGFEVVVHDSVVSFGDDEKTQLISLEKKKEENPEWTPSPELVIAKA